MAWAQSSVTFTPSCTPGGRGRLRVPGLAPKLEWGGQRGKGRGKGRKKKRR